MFRILASIVLAALVVLPALAAPVTKDKSADEPPGPITNEQLRKSANNLKQIALAIHNYEATYGVLPTNRLSGDNKPHLSWRVQILPYIEQDELYKQFKLDEPWDSEVNKKLIEKIPDVYVPVRVKVEKGKTFYQAFTGSHGWMKPGRALVAAFPDGTSNTFLVAEAAKPVVWTKPDDLEFDGKTVPALGGQFDGRFTVAFADGRVVRFKRDVDKELLRWVIDPADGMAIPNLDKAIDPDGDSK